MKFKCKEDFSYYGSQISINDNNDMNFFKMECSWKKDEIYDGKYYDGGVMCPVPAYIIPSQNGNNYIFTISDAKPTYMLVSEQFDLIE